MVKDYLTQAIYFFVDIRIIKPTMFTLYKKKSFWKGCFFLVFILFLFFYKKESLTLFFWQKFRIPHFAVVSPIKDSVTNFQIGRYYFNSKNYDLSLAQYFFERSISIDPNLPDVKLELARVYFIQGNFSGATELITEEINQHPENAKAYYVRALVYGYTNQLDLAEKDFIKFLEFVPESWAAHNDLAWIYFQKGDFYNAANTAVAGLESAPNNPWLNNSVGVSLMNLGDKEGAKKHFKLALDGFNELTPEEWGSAYPGNDPRLYEIGLESVRDSVRKNLETLGSK